MTAGAAQVLEPRIALLIVGQEQAYLTARTGGAVRRDARARRGRARR